MAPLQNKPMVPILVIVEGERREMPFVERFLQLYGINAKLYVFHTNIYTLYQAMEQLEFVADIRDVLVSLPNMQDQDLQTLRDTNFAYTYLIFDCEVQHRDRGEKSTLIDAVVKTNLQHLKKMAEYFTNETDPSVGKLYINYPMMESYRDCDSVFDDAYQTAFVCIDDIKDYKSFTGKKRMATRHIGTFSKEDFGSLLRMNVYKLNFIFTQTWGAPTYKEYQVLSEQTGIVSHEMESVISNRCIDVLNTTLFLLADYFGNQTGFYDNIMQL